MIKTLHYLQKTTDTVELYQGDEKFVFNVAGYLVEKMIMETLVDMYLIDSKDYDNQHILKYSKFKGEESYDSVITDGTQDELIRINDKFIEMGLKYSMKNKKIKIAYLLTTFIFLFTYIGDY